MTLKLKFDAVQAFLGTSVFLYVLSIFWVESLPGWSRLVHLSVAIMLASLLFTGWRQGLKLRREPVLLLFWLFFLVAYLSVYWSLEQGGAFVSLVSLLVNILGGTLVWISLWNGVSLRVVGYAAIAGATIQASVALNQFWAEGGELARFEGLTGNANALAVQLSIAAFLALATMRRSFWPPVIAFVFVLVATLLSGSRKIAFVWFVFVLLFLRYVGVQFRTSSLFRILLLLSLPLLVYAGISYSAVLLSPLENLPIYGRFQAAIEGSNRSANLRESMLYQGLDLWRDSPVWGYGIDQFRHISSFSTYSHNNYTELLVSFGLLGFTLYYAGLFILLLRSVRGLLKRSPEAALLGGAVTLLLFWDVALVAYSTRLIWLFLAVLGYLSEQQVNERTSPKAFPRQAAASSYSQ